MSEWKREAIVLLKEKGSSGKKEEVEEQDEEVATQLKATRKLKKKERINT